MENNEQNIQKNNLESIDMDCNCYDDDDFGGKIVDYKETKNISQNMPTISADFNNGNLEISKNYTDNNSDYVDTGVNLRSIDMECNCFDDDTDDFDSFNLNNSTSNAKETKNTISVNSPRFYDYKADFSDDYDDYTSSLDLNNYSVEEKEPELVITERKADCIDQGTIEKNYLDKLTKKHQNSNTKGSYNSYFHLAGNPEKEMQMFNHDMGSTTASGDITGTSSAEGSGDGCTSCGESLESYSKQNLLENLLVLIGFDVIPTKNKYLVRDRYNLTSDIECNSKDEVLDELTPYLNDMIITPLQSITGQDFTKPEEWVKWYNEQNQKDYPQCSNDINYCKCLCKGIENETK